MVWPTSRAACAIGCGAAALGLLEKSDAAVLDHAAELLRTVEHVARLVVGRVVKWLPATEHGRQVTERLTAKILGANFPEGLESELEGTSGSVRGFTSGCLGRVLQVERRLHRGRKVAVATGVLARALGCICKSYRFPTPAGGSPVATSDEADRPWPQPRRMV